jgi:hypothetical protein
MTSPISQSRLVIFAAIAGVGQCWQLKNDIDSYNERCCPDQPIQMDFNFNVDLEELGQLQDVA